MPRARKRAEDSTEAVVGGTAVQTSPQDSAPPSAKRQRVSLACDACRSAREKCDGNKPECGPCVEQQRSCSYTPASKKRGVQTGYLRTVELSLAWVLENVPESERALHKFLTENRTAAVQLLSGKGAAGSRLHKKLTDGRVHKSIAALLADPSPAGTSADDSDLEASVVAKQRDEVASHEQMPVQQPKRHKLPEDWRNLVATHFAHTHQWLPIVSKNDIIRVADHYPSQGVPEHEAGADDAVLWAVLALSAHQITRSGSELTAKQIFSTARDMIPAEDAAFAESHVNALLLQGLLLIGQGSPLAACLIISKASRVALQIHAINHLRHQAESVEARSRSKTARLLAACSVLDTWGALYLGQPSVLSVELNEKLRNTLSMDPWMLSTATRRIFEEATTTSQEQAEAEHLATLYQLHTFGCLVRECLRIRSFPGTAISMQRQITPEDLEHALAPQFMYCNSPVPGASSPLKSSSLLLQVAFRTAMVIITPHCRPSLLSSVFEAAEMSMTRFGVSSTPPLMVAFLSVVKDHGAHINSQEERRRWQSIIAQLQQDWSGDGSASLLGEQRQAVAGAEVAGLPPPTSTDMNLQPYATPTEARLSPIGQGALPFQSPYKASPAAYSAVSGGSDSLPDYVPLPAHGLAPASAVNHNLYSHSGGQGIDYQAIMQDLGSMEYSPGLGQARSDPQFMTNLGFAPDYDLGEMFQGYE